MLKVVGQDIISGAMGFVGTEPGWLYQMGSLNGVAKASGNLLTLKQCKNKPLKGLTIYGKSEQLTFTGANLFNVSSKQSGFVSGIEIGDKVEVSQNASYPKAVYFDEITVDSTKKYSFCFWNGSTVLSNDNVRIRIYNDNNVVTEIPAKNNVVNKKFADGTTKVRVLILDEFPNLIGMFCEGSTLKAYEPYTGGQPSPSPDYPQEIKSVVNPIVKVYGKNMMPYPKDNTVRANGVTLTAKDGKYTLVGKPTENTWMNIYPQVINYTESSMLSEKPLPTKGKKISMINGSVGYSLNFRKVSNRDKVFGIEHNNATLADEDSNGVFLYIFNIDKTYNDTFELMISDPADTTSTVFEPYTEQEVSLPYTLNAIPVPSDGNYTDENGQQWIADYADMKHGKLVRKIKSVKLNELSFRYEQTPNNKSNTFIHELDSLQAGIDEGYILCQYGVFDSVGYDIEMSEDCRCYVWRTSLTIQFKSGVDIDSVDKFTKWLESHSDASISYILVTPQEIPLTPDEIAVYKTLHTYTGITNISNDAEAWMQVVYDT